MHLVDGVASLIPDIPAELLPRVKYQTGCSLTEVEANRITIAYKLLAEYSKFHPFIKDMNCNVTYCHGGIVSIEADPGEIAYFLPLIVLPVDLINESASSEHDPLAAFVCRILEELCHALYLKQNEYQVKELAVKICRQMFPDLKCHEVFQDYFDDQDIRIPTPGMNECYDADYDRYPCLL